MRVVYHLHQLGITPVFVTLPKPSEDALKNRPSERGGIKKTNFEPIDAVLSGDCDAGVINQEVLGPFADRIVVLDTFPSPILWLAGNKLPKELKAQIGDALSELQGQGVLIRLSDSVEGYRKVTSEDLESLREASKVEMLRRDQSTPIK